LRGIDHFGLVLAGVAAGAVFFASGVIAIGIQPPESGSFRLNSTDVIALTAGFGGALIGAFVGGVISWLIARQGAWEALQAGEANRLEMEKTNVLRAILKVNRIANDLYTLRENIRPAIERNARQGTPQPLWTVVRQSVGHSVPRVDFDSSDFVAFVGAGHAEVISDSLLMSDRHATINATFDKYGELRSELQTFAAPLSKTDPATGLSVTTVPPNLQNQFDMQSRQLDELINQLWSSVLPATAEAIALSERFGKLAEEMFKGKGRFVRLSVGAEPEDQTPPPHRPVA
jgi:hypothetical protein